MKSHVGFTLIELMVVVAIIAILSAIALPAYTDYITKSRIPDATSNLASKRVQLEQYFQDNRTYVGAPACNNDATSSRFFTFSCSVAATATSYTLQAAGTGPMSGFSYTVDQSNTKASNISYSGWSNPSPNNCWATSKSGGC